MRALDAQLNAQRQQAEQFQMQQQLARDRMAQEGQFRQADDARLDAAAAPQQAYVDQYAQMNPAPTQMQVPNPFNLMGPRGALGTGEFVAGEQVDPAWQAQANAFAGAPAAVQRDILDNQARLLQQQQLGDYRDRSLGIREQGQQGLMQRHSERLDETKRRNLTTEGLAAARLEQQSAAEQAKRDGYAALARVLAREDPELAAEYALMAEKGVSPLGVAQHGLSAQRESRVAAGPPPSASTRRVSEMSNRQLLDATLDPNTKQELSIDATIELRNRMRELPSADVFEIWKAAPAKSALREDAEDELTGRGHAIENPWIGGPKLIGEGRPPQPKSASDEQVVPGKAPAADGPARINSDDEYNALPSGALFIGPDGVTRRKP